MSLQNINLVNILKCAHFIGGRRMCLGDKEHYLNINYLFLKGKE